MAYDDRIELYKRIEDKRGCPLIVYVTSSRQRANGVMAPDVIPEFAKQIKQISDDSRQVDILIVSSGGDPTVSWRIVSMLRERFQHINALLPFAAYSAATLLALGANKIVMHPFANLGPVDPQLTYTRPGKQRDQTVQFGSEDLRHFLEFMREDVGISDQQQLMRGFELVTTEVGSIPIGVAKRSSFLALTMGEKLLNLHMDDPHQAKAIAEALNRSFYHHGYPLGRSEAKEIGLPIADPDQELEDLMWQVWEDIENEMHMNSPFNPLHVVLSDPAASQILSNIPQAQLPSNLPPQVQQHVIQGVLNQITIANVPPVNYELFHATLESARCKSEFRTRGQIFAARNPDLSINVRLLPLETGWRYTSIPSNDSNSEAQMS